MGILTGFMAPLLLAGVAEAASVSGTVKFSASGKKGNCKDGYINFVPTGAFGNARSAKIDGNGNFSIPSNADKNQIDPGDYIVNVVSCKGEGDQLYSGEMTTNAPAQKVPGAIATDTDKWIWTPYKDGCHENGGAFSWLICDGMNLLASAIERLLRDVIAPLMRTEPLVASPTDPLFMIWGTLRDVANVAFVLIFMLTIFGTAIGLDNYTIKKMLPKIIAAAVLIQFSWWIAGLIIDVGNVLGLGLRNIFEGVFEAAKLSGASGLSFEGFGQKAALVGAFTAGAMVASLGLAAISASGIIGAILILLVVFGVLILRKIVILLLVVLAPIAFVLWVLPNTEKFFKDWYQLFLKLVLMFPLIVLLFMMGRLFSYVAGNISGPNSAFIPLYQLAGFVLPLALIPWTFGTAGKMFGAGVNGINKLGKMGESKFGRDSAGGKARADVRQKRAAMKLQDPNASKLGKFIARQRGGFTDGTMGLSAVQNFLAKKDAELPEGQRMGIEKNGVQAEQARRARNMGFAEMGEKGKDQAYEEHYSQYKNSLSPERMIETQKQVQLDQLLDNRMKEASMQQFTYTRKNDKGEDVKVTSRLSEAIGAKDDLKQLVQQSAGNKDYATMMAAMDVMGKNSGGRDELRNIRKELFGGDDRQKVDASRMEGNAATYYEKGTGNISADVAPDLKKTVETGFKGVSDRELAGMDYKTVGRYMEYAAGKPEIAAEASATIAAALKNERLSFGADQLESMYNARGSFSQPLQDQIVERAAKAGVQAAQQAPPPPAPAPAPAPAPPPRPTTPPNASPGFTSLVDPAVENQETDEPQDPRAIS